MKRRVVALLVGLLVFSCAKKMAPPSPDRFAPHLAEIVTRTRSQVELVFDEEIDPARVVADSYVLKGPDTMRVVLRGASLGREPQSILLWTPVQQPGIYEVRGPAWDRAGNRVQFRGRFRGSERIDTVPPVVSRVDPAPGTVRIGRNPTVRVRFSKAIDTTGMFSYMFVPSSYDTMFVRQWDADWQGVAFGRRDSLGAGTIAYFLAQPGLRDLEGNRTRTAAFTYFTPDSVLEAKPVRGRARWQRGLLGTGTVLLQTDSGGPEPTAALAAVLTDGSFFTKAKAGSYFIEAVADTDGDGLVDLASVPKPYRTEAESIELDLQPETNPRPISAYRR